MIRCHHLPHQRLTQRADDLRSKVSKGATVPRRPATAPQLMGPCLSFRSTAVIAGHAFVQNIRRGHYALAVAEPVHRRVAVAFDELALAI